MHHIADKLFSAGTWFATILYFIKEYFHASTVFSSMISMMTFILLVLQIANQWNIWREKRRVKKQNKKQ